MATIYNSDNLRSLFRSQFDMKLWYSFLQYFFKATTLRVTPEKIENEQDNDGYYLGEIETSDSYRIGLFYYKIEQGSVLNRRVGLRNLVKPFLKYEYDAAIAVFDSGNHWRLSFISDINGESTSPKRYTYLFGDSELLYKTAIDRFNFIQNKGVTFENLKKAFSVEALSDEFFNRYREQYANFIQHITGKRFVKVGNKWEERMYSEPNAELMQAFEYNEKRVRDYIKKMMGRITFLHFLQRKGWMCGDLNYMQNMFNRSAYQNDYLDSVLEPLFFGILNTKPEDRNALFTQKGWDKSLLAEWGEIPYLNGGLFEKDTNDETICAFPAGYFKDLFQFFSEYNFTIDENDPNDAEIGVDPEMLGKIFENLLEDNKDKGAFYTPKEIVRYMCQESLIAYLEANTSIAKEKIRQFVLSPEEGIKDIPEIKKPKLLAALEEVKICDPAIGSGAFPMGLLNELLHCREVLSGEHYDRAKIKKSIIQNNIYGVDIEKGAVDIARLRFWLSIVVDEEEASPLPNLDYKIMQGNSLIESYKGIDLSELTYKKKSKNDSNALSIFDDDINREQKILSQLLTNYYSCSDHNTKQAIRERIKETINKQLEVQYFDENILNELKNINLAENNKFFLWHTWFSDVFNRRDDKNGFDIVIGNPPYVNFANIKSVEYRTILKEKFYSTKNKCDLYAFFIEFGFDLLNYNGIITYIVPHTWKATDSFSKLREILFTKHNVVQIVNLEMGVFEATVQPLIILASKKFKKQNCIKILNNNYIHINDINIEEILSSKEYIIDTTSSASEKNIFRKIEKDSLLLSNYIKFSRGIKTSNDKKFINTEIISVNEQKKVFRGRNIRAYQLNWDGEYIWYRPDLMREKAGCVPHTKEFFEVAEKLITQRISRQLLVAYDDKQNYFLDTTNVSNYSTWDKKTPIKFLCGLLNSKLINFWYCKKYLMPTIGGYELHSIPIKTINDYSTFISLVDEAISAAQQNNYNILHVKMKEIDNIVYSIYGLTEEEIAIVESDI